VTVKFDANPAVSIAYHNVAFDDPAQPAFEIISRLLSSGRTSRLNKALVIDKQLALQVSVSSYPWGDFGSEYPGILYIDAYPKEGVSTDQVEAAIYEELNRLATQPVDEKELTKVKNQIEAEFIWASYRNIGLAGYLATAQNLAKDWKYLYKLQDDLRNVTAEDIMKTAKMYFTPENRTVAVLVPKEKGGDQ
jgi:predicted Zn-dependent peptidase